MGAAINCSSWCFEATDIDVASLPPVSVPQIPITTICEPQCRSLFIWYTSVWAEGCKSANLPLVRQETFVCLSVLAWEWCSANRGS